MANATAITVTTLTANDMTARPAGDTLDTGTSAVVLEADVGQEADRVILEVTNTAAEALSVQVSAGEDPPAWRKVIGALDAESLAQNAVGIFGPFETARVIQNDGKLRVTFTPGGTIAATIRCYKLPKV